MNFPEYPFLTESFTPRGGGLDFLGMRQVNLQILSQLLIPGINNATADVGTYLIGAWIPWKFKHLSTSKHDFKRTNFQAFQEAAEVVMAHSMRDGSPISHELGTPRNRIGIQQKLALPGKLNFKNANRTLSTSLYAAPLYGPSLRYLNLIGGDALAEDGSSTGIPITCTDNDTEGLASFVESSLQESSLFQSFDSLKIDVLNEGAVDDLGKHGLNPVFYRYAPRHIRLAFARKLLSSHDDDPLSIARLRTAQLLLDTLAQTGESDLNTIRWIWHTGLLPTGEKIASPPDLESTIMVWSTFIQRQFHRCFMELFLYDFENAVSCGCRTIEQIVSHSISSIEKGNLSVLTFEEFVFEEANAISSMSDIDSVARDWALNVGPLDTHYEFGPEILSMPPLDCALSMMARWWLRLKSWPEQSNRKAILSLGGIDRIGMAWFDDWLNHRRSIPLSELLTDLYRDLVFSQHLRVALYRFDGETQRLRFFMGDDGIEKSDSARDFGQRLPGLMADRLEAFAHLLVDLKILKETGEGKFAVGDDGDLLDHCE